MESPKSDEPIRRDVEELLRLKRSERPSPEFWDGFQDDLRREIVRRMVEPVPRRRFVTGLLAMFSGAWPIVSGSAAAMLALISLGTIESREDFSGVWAEEVASKASAPGPDSATDLMEMGETRFVVEVIESGVTESRADIMPLAGQADGFRFERETDFNASEMQFVTDTYSSGDYHEASGFEAAFFAN